MTRKNVPYRFFIAAMGPGEIGQGIAFAEYVIKQGDLIFFSVPSREYLSLASIKNANFSLTIVKNSKELKSALLEKKPHVLVLCNSKIFTREGNFMESPPKPKIPSLSIDSNWLFSPSSPYIFNPWIDRYCINLPEPVFESGLKKNGGHYSIPAENLKKIRVVGLVPSYHPISSKERKIMRKKYNVSEDEKLVFLYCSMSYLVKPIVFLKAYEAIKELRNEGYKIKVINFSDKLNNIINRKDKDWFVTLPLANADIFSKVLASSDLIFQHQGLSTLEQAISMGIPAIANVRDLKDEKNPKNHRHSWEVEPFVCCGTCSMFFFHDSIELVKKEIKKLLYDFSARRNMIKNQKSLYRKGEPAIYKEAIKLIRKYRLNL